MTSAVARRPRVLVVDDHDDSREMVETILAASDFDVVGVPDGESALALACVDRPDVVVTDLTLPRLSGEELASRLHGTPGLGAVPLVAMSGRDVEPSQRQAFAKTLKKPLDPATLPDAIRQVLASTVRSGERGRLPDPQYRLVVDHAPTMVWRSGTDAKCDWFNESWLTFTGRTMEQEVGEGWAEGVHPDDLARCLEHYLGSFAARRPFEVEYRLRRHDGVYRWILDRGVPFYTDDGAFAGFIGSCVDVDERVRADEGKTRFLRAMAHEMRTPLTPVAAYLHQLEGLASRGEPVPADLVTKLARQNERLVQLVDDLSTAARLEAGEALAVEPEEVDLGALVAHAVEEQRDELARPRAARRTVELVLRRPDVPVTVNVDPRWIDSAVCRVLANAIKFSPDGGVVEVEVRGSLAPTITVRDRGIGIPEAEIDRVGTPYFRASNAPLANYPGLGLGLATVKQIMTSHGGRLVVEGRRGGGANVSLTFPRSPGAPS